VSFKRRLAIELEKLRGFEKPKVWLEQYVTPAHLVAEIVSFAETMGDLERISKANACARVVDLGCGTGIISVAFELCGYESVGFDVDADAVRVARENARLFDLRTDFVLCDVRELKLRGRHLVVMNPPFGIKRRHADRPFLEKAFEIGEVIYSIHSAGSERFVRRLGEERGFEVTHVWRYKIPLKRTYDFHEKEFKQIAVEVYRIERRS